MAGDIFVIGFDDVLIHVEISIEQIFTDTKGFIINDGFYLLAGGLAWSGSYYPRREILDTDADGTVTVEEYVEHAGITLFGSLNRANMLMGWAYAEDSITNPTNFNLTPPFATVYDDMLAIGFHPDSAQIWGAYNSNFDFYKNLAAIPGNEAYWVWAGVGYLNLSSSLYLAEARGDGAADWQDYNYQNTSTYPDDPVEPILYDYLETNADTLGFNQEAVDYFLKIANSAEFSVPLIEIHGTKDSLVPTNGQGVAYREAVEEFGNLELHRLYLIENGMDVETPIVFIYDKYTIYCQTKNLTMPIYWVYCYVVFRKPRSSDTFSLFLRWHLVLQCSPDI